MTKRPESVFSFPSVLNSTASKWFLSLLFSFHVCAQVFAAVEIPVCKDRTETLSVDNEQILKFKKETQNGYLHRGFVQGTVTRVFPDRSGHNHFEIQIGKRSEDVLEVVYSQDFGPMPDPAPGMKVMACGDYITAYAKNGPYPPSPSKAIIHWVHFSNNERSHDHGFVVINDTLVGYRPESGAGRGPRGRRLPVDAPAEANLSY